jgi:hypothetical protein
VFDFFMFELRKAIWLYVGYDTKIQFCC